MLKQNYVYCEAGNAVTKICTGQATKRAVGPNLSTVGHHDSETSPKKETILVALLSDPCAIHHITESLIYGMTVNWEKCEVSKN